ncbi:MAG: hypothetical protein ACLS3V_00935 [Streptococcus sp.]
MIDTYFAKGPHHFNIDLTGKLKELTEMQGGPYVKIQANNRNHINLMQVIATTSSADGETTDQSIFLYPP